ncbi:MAG: hypothetical protein WBV82_22840 [Myxococcaceae bacterium]
MANQPSFLKAAFLAPANLIGLSAAGLGSLATSDPLPAAVAGITEVFYLAVTFFSPAFRKKVRAQVLAEAREGPEAATGALLEELAPSQREHYFALKDLRDKILANYQKLPGGGVLVASSEARVDALLTNFLRLLTTLNSYRTYLNAADRATIEREIAELQQELGAEDNARLRDVKLRRVDILQKRLQRFLQAEESREIVSHQLAGIEDLLRLTHEQSIAIRDPEIVTRQLDALSAEADATEETVREMERFMSISDEISSIPAGPEGGRVRT